MTEKERSISSCAVWEFLLPKGFVRNGNERERDGGGGGGGGGYLVTSTCVFDSMWTFQPVRFRARLSWPRPLPPPPPLSLSHSHFWRSLLANDKLFLVLRHTTNKWREFLFFGQNFFFPFLAITFCLSHNTFFSSLATTIFFFFWQLIFFCF